MHYVTLSPLAFASQPNHPQRHRCESGACDQLATVRWHFVHDVPIHAASDSLLCPEHAAEWATAYSDPDNQYWLGR
jgi:hypothetical protein